MSYITGFDRTQTALFPVPIDQIIDPENEVRFIDLFVDSLKLSEFGFKDVGLNQNGRPPYHPADLLKLYIYGYLNRIRSSRGLEKECKRNIELIWLIKGLVPDHNTIANFRKDNPKAIKQVFRQTVNIAKNMNLIGGILIAGDGTRLRAQNSKKNNYNQKKIDRHLAYIESKLDEYNQALASADGDQKEAIEKKIEKQNTHKDKYKKVEQQLQQSGQTQISTSDPDSRQMMIRGLINEVAYNVQSTVDAKHKLPIDYQVTNQNDKNALAPMVEKAIDILGNNTFEAVFDKGYYNAEQLFKCHQMGVETHVAITAPASTAPDPAFNVSEFVYNSEEDTYTCPANQTLRTNGNWYQKKSYRVKQYKTPHCIDCSIRDRCTRSRSARLIERHEFAKNIERNKRAQAVKPDIYKQRQAIVEHPFGTMKRQWGYDHIMTKKSLKHAAADVGFIFIAYNLRRLINIIGIKALIKLFRSISTQLTYYLTKFYLNKQIKLHFYTSFKYEKNSNIQSLNSLLSTNLQFAT